MFDLKYYRELKQLLKNINELYMFYRKMVNRSTVSKSNAIQYRKELDEYLVMDIPMQTLLNKHRVWYNWYVSMA